MKTRVLLVLTLFGVTLHAGRALAQTNALPQLWALAVLLKRPEISVPSVREPSALFAETGARAGTETNAPAPRALSDAALTLKLPLVREEFPFFSAMSFESARAPSGKFIEDAFRWNVLLCREGRERRVQFGPTFRGISSATHTGGMRDGYGIGFFVLMPLPPR